MDLNLASALVQSVDATRRTARSALPDAPQLVEIAHAESAPQAASRVVVIRLSAAEFLHRLATRIEPRRTVRADRRPHPA